MAKLSSKDLGQLLRADYHYSYKANNGNIIKIEVGDEFILIKKSNEDWWQVIKLDQKKPFYVPANYMKELHKFVYPSEHSYFKKAYTLLQKLMNKGQSSNMAPLNQASEKQTVSFHQESGEGVGSREDLSNLNSKNKFSNMRASSDSLDRFIENENPYDEVPLDSKFSPPVLPGRYTAHSSAFGEEPEYENLENIQSRLAESRRQLSPNLNAESDVTATDQLHPIPANEDDPPRLSNAGYRDSRSTHLPFPQPSNVTAVEVPEGEWVVKLDNHTNSKHFINARTDEMDVELPPGVANDQTTTRRTSISPSSARRIVPPAPPDVSMKPTLQRHSISPKSDDKLHAELNTTSSAQPGHSLPEVVDEEPYFPPLPVLQTGWDEMSKSGGKESSKNKNSNNNNNAVERNSSFRDRFFRDSERKKGKYKHKKTSSDVVSQISLARTAATVSPLSLSPDDNRLRAPLGWLKERSSEGGTLFIRKSNGDRWQQLLDSHSDKHYYYNPLTKESAWQLPKQSPMFSKLDNDELLSTDTLRDRDEEDDVLLERTAHRSSIDVRMRKASTIEREKVSTSPENEFTPQQHSSTLPLDSVPPVSAKPRKSLGFRKQAERVMVVQSMYVPQHSAPVEEQCQMDRHRSGSDKDSSFAPLPHPMIMRQGRLSWTKLTEAGKKQRKHWMNQWVVLLANNLLFYKDEKQALPTKSSPHGKPESSCELRGASVEWANEKSSKKNVIELQTVRGLSLLLQHEDQATVSKWLNSIKTTIQAANQADDVIVSKTPAIEDEEENETKKKKDKKKDKKHKPTRQNSDVNVRSRLKKFISRRPTLESLQERGIIRETVFGCPLVKLCEKENTTVPNFVKLCVEEVERRGLDVDGIYRVSGNLSHVQKLRYLIDQDEPVNLDDQQWDDIHVITGALKLFLRELPEPVIPFAFFDKFIAACKIQYDKHRVDAMKALVKVLPKMNSDTLRYLMMHFCKVVDHSLQNRMHVQNIAIVFGPTLLLKPKSDVSPNSQMTVYLVYQNQIIDEMLSQCNTIFG